MKIRNTRSLKTNVELFTLNYGEVFQRTDEKSMFFMKVDFEDYKVGLISVVELGSGSIYKFSPDLIVTPVDAELVINGTRA